MSLQGVSGFFGTPLAAAGVKLQQQDNASQAFSGLLDAGTKKLPQSVVAAVAEAQPVPVTTAKSATGMVEAKEKTPAEQFLEYMAKTPEQRWREAWLKQHNMTEKDFEALSPEKKQAIEAQMAQDLKEQIRQTAEKKASDPSAV